MNIFDFKSDVKRIMLSPQLDGNMNKLMTQIGCKKAKRQIMRSHSQTSQAISFIGNNFKNVCFIIPGNIGIDETSGDFVRKCLIEIDEYLSKSNSKMILMNGVYDNVEIGSIITKDLNNVFFANGISLIFVGNDTFITIGGDFPIDKDWRVERGMSTSNELPQFDLECLSRIPNENKVKSVISLMVPPFVENSSRIGGKWFEKNPELYIEYKHARSVIGDIYMHLYKQDKLPEEWIAPNIDSKQRICNTLFKSIGRWSDIYDGEKISAYEKLKQEFASRLATNFDGMANGGRPFEAELNEIGGRRIEMQPAHIDWGNIEAEDGEEIPERGEPVAAYHAYNLRDAVVVNHYAMNDNVVLADDIRPY